MRDFDFNAQCKVLRGLGLPSPPGWWKPECRLARTNHGELQWWLLAKGCEIHYSHGYCEIYSHEPRKRIVVDADPREAFVAAVRYMLEEVKDAE